TWWAGAAFLPLDPAAPLERLAFVVRDAGLSHAVAHPVHTAPLQALGVRVIDPGESSTAPGEPHRAGPEELAYVIYTSGSTGQPKGVLVTQRGITGLLDAQIEAFGLGPGCRSLWLLSPLFDASVSDVGTALLAGATLCIEPDTALRSPAGLL